MIRAETHRKSWGRPDLQSDETRSSFHSPTFLNLGATLVVVGAAN